MAPQPEPVPMPAVQHVVSTDPETALTRTLSIVPERRGLVLPILAAAAALFPIAALIVAVVL